MFTVPFIGFSKTQLKVDCVQLMWVLLVVNLSHISFMFKEQTNMVQYFQKMYEQSHKKLNP